jgi:hypothetical protein
MSTKNTSKRFEKPLLRLESLRESGGSLRCHGLPLIWPAQSGLPGGQSTDTAGESRRVSGVSVDSRGDGGKSTNSPTHSKFSPRETGRNRGIASSSPGGEVPLPRWAAAGYALLRAVYRACRAAMAFERTLRALHRRYR